jgi:hypothetical protein
MFNSLKENKETIILKHIQDAFPVCDMVEQLEVQEG